MSYVWTDVQDIAIELNEKHPDINPETIRFTQLHKLVCELENFDAEPNRSNERILEAIQACWIEERS